jgi:hypothetical protein
VRTDVFAWTDSFGAGRVAPSGRRGWLITFMPLGNVDEDWLKWLDRLSSETAGEFSVIVALPAAPRTVVSHPPTDIRSDTLPTGGVTRVVSDRDTARRIWKKYDLALPVAGVESTGQLAELIGTDTDVVLDGAGRVVLAAQARDARTIVVAAVRAQLAGSPAAASGADPDAHR